MVFFLNTTIDSFVFCFLCFLLFVVGATPYLVVQVGDLLEVGAFLFLLAYVHISSIFSSKQSHIVISCTIKIWICESLVIYATMNTCELIINFCTSCMFSTLFPSLFVLFLNFLFLFLLCCLCLLMLFFLSFFGFVCLR
jgi:hypothetical protein